MSIFGLLEKNMELSHIYHRFCIGALILNFLGNASTSCQASSGIVHKRRRIFLAIFDTPPPCRNFSPNLSNLLISFNIEIWDPFPLECPNVLYGLPLAIESGKLLAMKGSDMVLQENNFGGQ